MIVEINQRDVMHYVNKLKQDISILTEFKDELLKYLSSDKFNGIAFDSKMVNRNDIIMRIYELENNLINRGE